MNPNYYLKIEKHLSYDKKCADFESLTKYLCRFRILIKLKPSSTEVLKIRKQFC